MNTALSDAMRSAQMGAGGLATRVGVTRKTVERWLADPLKIPHPRTSADVAEVLGASETVLWPKAVRSSLKTGPEREILNAYPYRNACPSPVWSRLIETAERRIVFAGYTNYFLWQEQPRLVERLHRKAENGCEVHVLVGDPESPVTQQREDIEDVALTVSTRIRVTLDALARLREVDGVQARFSDRHIALSVFLFDDEALVTPHLSSLLGHDSPMLHLRRLADDGLYDRFAGHVTALWNDARPVWE